MYPEINQNNYEESGLPEDLPFISIIIPFEPRMAIKSGFDNIIKKVAAKTEKEVMSSYPENKATPVIKKMHHALYNLDVNKHKKQSIGIFVSPLLEKVYYFNYHTPPANGNYRTAS